MVWNVRRRRYEQDNRPRSPRRPQHSDIQSSSEGAGGRADLFRKHLRHLSQLVSQSSSFSRQYDKYVDARKRAGGSREINRAAPTEVIKAASSALGHVYSGLTASHTSQTTNIAAALCPSASLRFLFRDSSFDAFDSRQRKGR